MSREGPIWVARAVAEEMELDRTLIETTNIAGNLMNLGKIAVPSEILTKQGQLTDEEMRMIQQSVLTSAEMVRRIDFDGPVYETLAQLLAIDERATGTRSTTRGTAYGIRSEPA